MLCMTCNAAPISVAAGNAIPFDTVVCATNGNARRNGNAAEILAPGWYMAILNAVISDTTGMTDTIQLYAQGEPVSGASMTVDIPAGGTATVCIEWPVQVVNAEMGVASITWVSSAAVTLDSATEIIRKAV